MIPRSKASKKCCRDTRKTFETRQETPIEHGSKSAISGSGKIEMPIRKTVCKTGISVPGDSADKTTQALCTSREDFAGVAADSQRMLPS